MPAILDALLLVLLPPGPACAAADGAELERRLVLAELNTIRRDAGAGALRPQPALCETARWRAHGVAASGEPAPDLALLETATRRLLRAGYQSHRWIESTLVGSSAAGILEQWRQASPGWFEQAATGDFEHVGIGWTELEERPGRERPGRGRPVVTLLLALSARTFEWRQAAPLADRAEVRREVLAAVNAARREAVRGPVASHRLLDAAAQSHAEDMLRRSYYDHRSPEGTTAAQRVRALGFRPRGAVAENIAKGNFSAREVVRRWLASSGHRRNVLRRAATLTGLGVAFGENDNGFEVTWVQLFADGGG